MDLSRRAWLSGVAAMLAAPAAAQQPRPREEEPLILRARRKGLVYGSAVTLGDLANPVVAEIVADECGLIEPPPSLDWAAVQPQPGRFDFTGLDRVAGFAQRRNLLLRLPAVVRHSGLPDWMAEGLTPASAGRTLAEHLGPLVARYRGRVHSWDVVGGAVEPAHGRTDGLRVSPWLRAMGPRYIDTAFRLARALDRDTLLAYGDGPLEGVTPEHEARRRAVLGLLQWLKSRGTPVDALAVHSTLDGSFDPAVWRMFLREIGDLRLRLIVRGLSAGDADIRTAAERMGRYVETTLEEGAVIAVVSDGLSDYAGPGLRGAPGRPLDADLNRTPVWAALARAFDAAPSR